MKQGVRIEDVSIFYGGGDLSCGSCLKFKLSRFNGVR